MSRIINTLLLVCVTFFVLISLYGKIGFILSSILILLQLTLIDKSTRGVFLLWIFFSPSGMWGDIYGIPKAGLITFIIAIFSIYQSKINRMINFRIYILKFTPILLVFSFFYLLGPMHSYSNQKIIYIVYKGIFFIIAFIVLINNPKIDYQSIAVLTLIVTYQYYAYVSIKLDWFGPSHFFDFGSLRSFYTNNRLGVEERLINYQTIGMVALVSYTLTLNQLALLRLKNITALLRFSLTIITSLLLILYSGSRQSLYSVPIITMIALYFDKRIKTSLKTKIVVAGILAILFFISYEGAKDNSNLTLSKGSKFIEKINRTGEITHALKLIDEAPWLGHGLGGFTPFPTAKRYYPHNIFLEILSETGVVGLIILVVIMLNYWQKNKIKLNQHSSSGVLILPVFIVLFIRANLSSDLIETIFIFSFIVAWGAYNHRNKTKSILA